mmetsp:Transcript_24632/g.45450  ORF Transcript_24632/g.45450 Transcript_24632/m.45450 type:complete len:498 (+) Transcript_24632:52-1545(+)
MWQGMGKLRAFSMLMSSLVVVSISASMDHALLQITKTGNLVKPTKVSEAPKPASKKTTSAKKPLTKTVAKTKINGKTGTEKVSGPGSTAELTEGGYRQLLALKKNQNQEMEVFIRRVAKNMSMEIVDDARLHGVVPFYSGVKAKQSLSKLQIEIVNSKGSPCEAWVVEEAKKMPKNWTGFTAPLNEDGYITVARKHNDSEMEKFIEREIVDLNYEITDVSGLLGLSPFHSCAKGARSFDSLQKELLVLAATPGTWLRLKGTTGTPQKPGPHSADTTLQREEFAKDMAAKRDEYNANLTKEQSKKQTSADTKKTKNASKEIRSFVLQDMQPVGTANSESCSSTFQEMSGEDVSDMDISGENEHDLDAKCCSACSANAKCDFWVRESETSGTVICWLKASKTGDGPLQNANRRGGWNKVKLLQDAGTKLSGSGTLGAKEGPSGVMMQHDAKKKLSGLSGRAMLDSEAYKQKLKQETSMMKEKRDAYDWRVELQKILDEA